ncbi:MAG: hypothetical protein H7177_03860 [Rhizobacter sp.]|nr:hypothetical protein [Bacteriovorax sp.]
MPVAFNILHWFSSVMLVFLSFYCFNRASSKTGLYLCIFFLLLGGWCLTAALTFSIPELSNKIEISRIKFLFVPWIPVCVFFLSRCFSDHDKLSKPTLFLILSVPAITVIIASSPYNHYLITNYQLENILGYSILTFKNGPWFAAHLIHSRIIMLWALFLLGRTALTNHLIRRTSWIIFFSILIPFLIDSLAVFYFPIMRYIQIVPVTLIFTAACFYYVVFKENILELVPIARNMVIDSIPDIYLVIDYRNHLVDFNHYAKQAFGLNNKSNGKILKSISTDSNGIMSYILGMLETKKTESEFSVTGIEQIYYSIKFENIVSKTDQLMGKVIIVKNITEQKKHEKQLTQTLEIRTKFIGIMAHDLIGNVSGHSLFLESLLVHKIVEKDPDLKAGLDFLLHSSQNVTKFVEGLLSWSKENLDSIQLKKTKADLHYLISDSIHFLQSISIQKDIEYVLNVPVKTLADVDTDMIRTVIRNILANAIKVSPLGSTITVNAEINEESVEVCIIDEGPGVDEEELNKFLKGINIDSYKGGLGLTLCRDFVHLHNGIIKVKNNHPTGAIFSFILPTLSY